MLPRRQHQTNRVLSTSLLARLSQLRYVDGAVHFTITRVRFPSASARLVTKHSFLFITQPTQIITKNLKKITLYIPDFYSPAMYNYCFDEVEIITFLIIK